jgi:hypothetical protein
MSSEDPRNLLNEKERHLLERDLKIDAKNLAAGLGHVLSAPTGRMWMWDLIGKLRMLSTAMRDTPNVPDGVLISLQARSMERIKIAEELLSACENHFPEQTRMMSLECMQREDTEKQVRTARKEKRANGGSDERPDTAE